MVISLGEFERRYGVNKGTVSRRARDMGFDTSQGLSIEAVAALEIELNVKPHKPTPISGAEPQALTIHSDNHRGQLSLPDTPTAIDLGGIRGDAAALSAFDEGDIERFLGACDGFLEAVEGDYQHQLAVTQRKEAGVQKVRAKVDEVKSAQLRYQVRSESIALHNRGLDAELQSGMAILGKGTAGDGGDS